MEHRRAAAEGQRRLPRVPPGPWPRVKKVQDGRVSNFSPGRLDSEMVISSRSSGSINFAKELNIQIHGGIMR